MAVPPHALAVALDDQAIAVVLDFVEPVRAVGHLGAAQVGRQDSNGNLGMRQR